MSIAVQADIEAILQITFDLDPEPKATAVIEAAQRLVESAVGTPFDEATGLSVKLTGRGQPALLLPRWPVTAVAGLTVDGIEYTADDYTWDTGGYLTIADADAGAVWWSTTNGIVVSYDAGWADETKAPGGLRQLVAKVAARIWQTGIAFAENQGASGIVQETIGGYSVTYGDFSKDAAGAAALNDAERNEAREYRRRRVGSIAT